MNKELENVINEVISEIKMKIKDVDQNELCESLCYQIDELYDYLIHPINDLSKYLEILEHINKLLERN